MNLTSLISKSAKSLALLAMLAAMPMAASAEEMAKTPASQLTYEPQLDNQRDPNQYCAKCHKFDQVDKNQTLDQSGGELHFGKFHGAHLNQKSPNTGKPINCVNCHGNISEDHRRGAKDVMKNQCIPRKNKTKFVLLVTNQQNFVKNFGRTMFTQ